MELRVWAPRPGTVDIVLEHERRPMTRDGSGWWTAVEGDVVGLPVDSVALLRTAGESPER